MDWINSIIKWPGWSLGFWNGITALAAAVAALVAIIAVLLENKRSNFSFGVDLILKLEKDFNSERMKAARKAAAIDLLNSSDKNTTEILDFFEFMGYLTRQKALDKKMVWEMFYYFLSKYYTASKHFIEKERSKDSTVWANLPYLYSCLSNIEKRERGCSDSDLAFSKKEISDFLTDEAHL